jgi:hypothetical protein
VARTAGDRVFKLEDQGGSVSHAALQLKEYTNTGLPEPPVRRR